MGCTARAGWRALPVIATLLANFLWGTATGQAVTLHNLTPKPTPTPTLPPLLPLNDVAQRLPGEA